MLDLLNTLQEQEELSQERCEKISNILQEIVSEIANNNQFVTWSINRDYSVDVYGDVTIDMTRHNLEFEKLPIQFNHVKGRFTYKGRQDKNLQSLHGFPKKVSGALVIENAGIKNLEGAPQYVATSVSIRDCTFLETLSGTLSHVGGSLYVYDSSHLTSLHNIHKSIKYISNFIDFNQTTSSAIQGDVLGLLLIKGLRKVSGYYVQPWGIVINQYLERGDRDIIECQDELIEFGMERFARL